MRPGTTHWGPMSDGPAADLGPHLRSAPTTAPRPGAGPAKPQSIPQIVFTAAADGTPDFVVRPGQTYSGYRPQPGVGWGWLALVHPDDADHVRDSWARSVESGLPFDIECRLRASNGSYRRYVTRAWPVRGAHGAVVKWIGAAADVDAIALGTTGDDPEILRYPDLVIDLGTRTVVRRAATIDLTRREFDLLSHLALEAGRPVSRARLLEVAWSSSADWQSPATITEHVRRLRVKLEDDPSEPQLITTVRGSGYRFEAPLASETTTTPSPGDSDLERTQDALILMTDTEIVSATPAALDLLGADDLTQVTGRHPLDFIAARSKVAARTRHETVASGSWPMPQLITMQRLDGVEVSIQMSSAPVQWRGIEVSQVSIWPMEPVPVDALSPSDEMPGSEGAAVIRVNSASVIESFNPNAEALYGWTAPEVIGRSVFEVLPWLGDPAQPAQAATELEQHGHWTGHLIQLRRDGTPVLVAASVTSLDDAEGHAVGVISVNREVSTV